MARKAEAGHVGQALRAVTDQDLCGLGAGLLQGIQRGLDIAPLGPPGGCRGEQRTTAARLGENEHRAVLEAGLAPDHAGIDSPVYGEADRQFRTFAGVAADDRTTRGVQDLLRACHHLVEVAFLFVGGGERQHDGDQRGMRLRAHRVDIAQAVVGRDLARQERVADGGGKLVDGLDEHLARGRFEGGGIVAGTDGDGAVRAAIRARGMVRPDPLENAGEGAGADFRAAALAAHGARRKVPADVVGDVDHCWHDGIGDLLHRGQLVELLHELRVDVILPPPYPVALLEPVAPGGDGGAVAG